MSADISTLVSTGIVIIGSLGGAVGYFAKSRGDSIIKYQAIEITNRNETIARIEKDSASLRSENKLLYAQNKKLGELAQGNPQLTKLTDAITTLTNIVNVKLRDRDDS